LEALTDEEYYAERPFFWESLHGLAAHGYGAERVWLQRIGGQIPASLPAASDFSSFAELRTAWESLWCEWHDYVGSLTARGLEEPRNYRVSEGNEIEIRMDDVLRHVFNHATEHRSQMTPVLAQLGHPTEPLDYGRFAATNKP